MQEMVLRIRIQDLKSGAFLNPGSRIQNRFFSDPGSLIPNPKKLIGVRKPKYAIRKTNSRMPLYNVYGKR